MSCPTPTKVRYKNALEACVALEIILKKNKIDEHTPKRMYECRCGGWHLTKQPLDNPEYQTGVRYQR